MTKFNPRNTKSKARLAKIIKHASFAFAAIAVLLSIIAGVSAYEVIDPDDYRLVIQDVKIVSKDYIQFNVYNHGLNDFSYLDLHEFDIDIDDTKTSTKFSHTLGEPLAVLGTLDRHEEQQFTLPFDYDGNTDAKLRCGERITIELFTIKGKLVGKWAGIPMCEIEAPRPDGLFKTSSTTATYDDQATVINWKLVDMDRTFSKVLLSKQKGSLEPRTAWYSADDCPDVEAGKCMTDLTIQFSSEEVWVTLHDRRLNTKVTLTRPLWIASEEQFEIVTTTAESDSMVADTYDAELTTEPMSSPGELEITHANGDSQIRTCLEGCPADNNCYHHGTQHHLFDIDVYCEGTTWLVQKAENKPCENDYECVSNSCSGVCSEEGTDDEDGPNWITRLLLWIDNLI